MQVIKRDGSIAEYDRAKIAVAIGKANAEVEKSERVSKEEIEDILDYIESKKKKRMLVEDIQDIIEEKMMEQGHFELAKTYIIYRYTRALVRKANTTDEAVSYTHLLYLPYEKYEKVVFIGKVLVKGGAPYHGAAAQLFHGDVLEMLFFE